MPGVTAAWLMALPGLTFQDVVASDCAAALDDQASSALRAADVLSRWLTTLDAMIAGTQACRVPGRLLADRRSEAARLLAAVTGTRP